MDSPVAHTIFGDGDAVILGGSGQWALVSYTAGDGVIFAGWMEPGRQDPASGDFLK